MIRAELENDDSENQCGFGQGRLGAGPGSREGRRRCKRIGSKWGTLWIVTAPEGMKLSFHLSREGEQNKDMSKLMEDGVERIKEESCQGQGLDFYLGEPDLVPVGFYV